MPQGEHNADPRITGDPVARFFRFAERGTTYRREIVGGVTTFLAMAYIIFVNPAILGAAGMPQGALFTATILTTIAGCLLMAFLARWPVGVAPSMGMNAFFAYSVVLGMGIDWRKALVGALVASVVFVGLSAFRLRQIILDAVPPALKRATTTGIGLFIAFIGLQGSGIVVADKATLVHLGDLTEPSAALTIFGLLVSTVLMLRKVPGAIFIGMLATAVLGMATGVIAPPSTIVDAIPSIEPLLGVAFAELFAHPAHLLDPQLLVVAFVFLFAEFFDASGTLIGIAMKADLMEGNRMRGGGRALLADSLSTVVAATLGISPANAYIESMTGVAAGARTGFTALVIAALFALALFFSPLLAVVTPAVTAPALIIVGILMAAPLKDIDWERLEIAIPAFVMVVMMPLTYSIADGIALGLVAYPVTMIAAGRYREVHPVMYVLFAVFIVYFAWLI